MHIVHKGIVRGDVLGYLWPFPHFESLFLCKKSSIFRWWKLASTLCLTQWHPLWKLWLCLLMQVSVKVHILDIIFFQFWWCRLGLLRGFVPQFSPWWDIPYCLQQSSFMTKSSWRCFREIWLFYPVERLSCEKEIYKLESGIKLIILLYYFLWSSFYLLYW